MSDPQLRALRELLDGPAKLHGSTGEALRRQGYVDRVTGYSTRYRILDRGRLFLEARDRAVVERSYLGELDEKLSKRLDRALSWIRFSGHLTSEGLRYARTVGQGLLLKREIPKSGYGWSDEEELKVLDIVGDAFRAVDDLDGARKIAGQEGELTVSFEGSPPSPVQKVRQVRSDLEVATRDDGIVDFSVFKKRQVF